MNESDLLIVIGASFSNHTGIATYKKIAQSGAALVPAGTYPRLRHRQKSAAPSPKVAWPT